MFFPRTGYARAIEETIATHLERIRKVFRPPVAVTLVVRHPDVPGGRLDVVLGDDDLPTAASVLARLSRPQPRTEGGVP